MLVGLGNNYGNSVLSNFTGEGKTYFKQCFSAYHNNFYIGTCRMDRRINYVNYILIKFGKKIKYLQENELQYLYPKIAL